MTSDITIPFYQYILDEANGLPELLHQGNQDAFAPLRAAAIARFRSLGIPTLKSEDWRYTNIQRFLKGPFELAVPEAHVEEAQLAKAAIPAFDAYRIVLVNGHFKPALSQLPAVKGITICPLSEAAGNAAFAKYFDKHIHLEKHPFAALNTALFADGLFLEAAAKTILDKPLHIVHVYSTDTPVFIQPRHLWVVHPQAEVQVVESALHLQDEAMVFVNGVTEVVVEENAELSHYDIQQYAKNSRHIYHTVADQQTYSRYHNYSFSLPHAELIRNNLSIALNGSYTETDMHGLYLATDHQHVDNHTFVDHRMPNCNSNELYKGVLMDNANGVFTGKIHVHVDAQKTNAFQQNNNLLLSTKADINSQPQLEIYADDVKCSHGFTVGQFNPESLFYLRSRGIGEEAARTLLVNAFAYDITNEVKIPAIQQYVSEQIRHYVSN